MIGEEESQQARLDEMSDEEKKIWGFLPGETVIDKKKGMKKKIHLLALRLDYVLY